MLFGVVLLPTVCWLFLSSILFYIEVNLVDFDFWDSRVVPGNGLEFRWRDLTSWDWLNCFLKLSMPSLFLYVLLCLKLIYFVFINSRHFYQLYYNFSYPPFAVSLHFLCLLGNVLPLDLGWCFCNRIWVWVVSISCGHCWIHINIFL